MTRTKRFPIHLPILAAKTWAEYLAEHDNDAEKAGQAARRDLANRETQNTAARRFQQAHKGTIEALGLSADVDDPEAAADAGRAAVAKLKGDAGNSGETSKQLEAAHAALKELGIDPAKIKEGVESAKAKFANAEKAGKLEREVEYGKAAKALGFDAAKLAHQFRDEPNLPELRKIKVKVRDAQGNETEQEQDVWGVPNRDAQGKETGFTSLTEHGGVKGFEAALKVATETTSGVVTPKLPTLPAQPAAPAAAPASVKLDLSGGISTGNAV